MRPIDILIPSWNNPEFLNPCVDSIIKTGILHSDARLVIVNNGQQRIKDQIGALANIEVLEPGRNLGWEGGLAYALERSEAKFVCFQNDDTFIPKASTMIYQRLLIPFADRSVGAVGPVTNVAAGQQSIFHPQSPRIRILPKFLIFFMVMIRREHLDAVGGIDTSLTGGDDFDLSIRMRKAGLKLVVEPDAFVIHHGFKTGTRIHGGHESQGGWNSQEMQDRTNQGLIRKHGFKTFIDAICVVDVEPANKPTDLEGDVVRSLVGASEKVLELGCGGRKTIERAIGVDHSGHGEDCTHLSQTSVADVQADVQEPLPFEDFSQDCIIARHILEHCIDQIETLKNWNRVLNYGGRLIIAVPDEQVTEGIPMNPEHCHAYTQDSLANLLATCGFRKLASMSSKNGISFVACFSKIRHPDPVPAMELIHAA